MRFVHSAFTVAFVLLFSCGPLASQKAVPPASQQEESRMFGRLLAAVEDEGGNYLREALARFASIEKDLKKRQYSAHTQWMAHYEYGKTFLAASKPKDAVRFLEIASKDAESLTAKEQQETSDALREARAKTQ
jgi:hypothetical protein